MENIPTKNYLYHMVLKDFIYISEKYSDAGNKKGNVKAKDNTSKDDQNKKEDNRPVNYLLNDCQLFMLSYKLENNNYRRIYNSLENYINIIKDHFDANAKTSSFKADEHDIYVAYVFLWGIKFLIEDTKLESISIFKYSDYKNFTILLNKYGNSRNISKNYNKNFNNELIKNKIIDININIAFVNKWHIKWKKENLTQYLKKPKKLKKKSSQKMKKTRIKMNLRKNFY